MAYGYPNKPKKPKSIAAKYAEMRNLAKQQKNREALARLDKKKPKTKEKVVKTNTPTKNPHGRRIDGGPTKNPHTKVSSVKRKSFKAAYAESGKNPTFTWQGKSYASKGHDSHLKKSSPKTPTKKVTSYSSASKPKKPIKNPHSGSELGANRKSSTYGTTRIVGGVTVLDRTSRAMPKPKNSPKKLKTGMKLKSGQKITNINGKSYVKRKK